MKGDFQYTCCFFGHRKTGRDEAVKEKVRDAVEKLIVEEKVFTFLFGSKSGTEIAWRKAEKAGREIIVV